MHLSADQLIFWQWGAIKLNGTIAVTWMIMAILVIGARVITAGITNDATSPVPRWQLGLEIVVAGIREQIREVGLSHPDVYLGFIGTIFLFLATSNLLTIVPFYEPPTGSLSTTTALALSVFVAVPLYGIRSTGFLGYLRSYLEPTFLMLPFNIIGELSRTLALAVRLFGNMMSGSMILAILLTVTPLFFPIIMSLLGLLTGMVQAYIFSILATVYIAAATKPETQS